MNLILPKIGRLYLVLVVQDQILKIYSIVKITTENISNILKKWKNRKERLSIVSKIIAIILKRIKLMIKVSNIRLDKSSGEPISNISYALFLIFFRRRLRNGAKPQHVSKRGVMWMVTKINWWDIVFFICRLIYFS